MAIICIMRSSLDGSVKCIEDEIPFDLPDGWAWAKINTIAFVTKLAGFEYTKNIARAYVKMAFPLSRVRMCKIVPLSMNLNRLFPNRFQMNSSAVRSPKSAF